MESADTSNLGESLSSSLVISPICEADEDVEHCAAAGGVDVLAKRLRNEAWLFVRRALLSCLTALRQGEALRVFMGGSCCQYGGQMMET